MNKVNNLGYVTFLSVVAALGGFFIRLRYGCNIRNRFAGFQSVFAYNSAKWLVCRLCSGWVDYRCTLRRDIK